MRILSLGWLSSQGVEFDRWVEEGQAEIISSMGGCVLCGDNVLIVLVCLWAWKRSSEVEVMCGMGWKYVASPCGVWKLVWGFFL